MLRRCCFPLLVALLTVISPAQAQTDPVTAQAERLVIVRSGPGFGFSRIGLLLADEQVRITGRGAGGAAWLRIERGTGEGWIARFAVAIEGDPLALSAVAPRSPVRVALPADLITAQAFRTVNVRSEPSNRSEIVGRLTRGDEVIVAGRSDERTGWLLVDLEGVQGWVAYFTVTLTGMADDLPIIDSETGLEVTPAPPAPANQVIAYAFRTVNVRSGPGTDFDQITQLVNGDAVSVTGRSDAANNWLQIEFNGGGGWVAYFTVSVSGDPDSLPIVEIPVDEDD